jgi:hypothetical protein
VNEFRTRCARATGDNGGRYGSRVRRGLALIAIAAVAALLLVGAAGAAEPKAPVAGITLDGTRLSLADLRGKPVLINVWSSW